MQTKLLTRKNITQEDQSSINKLIGDSFFTSKGFMELWPLMSGTPVYWVVEDSNEVIAVLPAVEFGMSKLKRLQALPDGCYSSLYIKKNVDIEHVQQKLLSAVYSYGYIKIFIYDFYDTVKHVSDYERITRQTTLIDVSSSEWQPPDKKLQSEIRKAERESVQIEKFNNDKHLVRFFELMRKTESRHDRKPKYSDFFFSYLSELAESDNRIIWNWCEHEGKAVSSHINFIEKNQIINWQVYFDKQFSTLKANQKMLFELAVIAREKNIQYLNLGASPLESSTLVEYKNKWGGVMKEYYSYEHKSFLGKIL